MAKSALMMGQNVDCHQSYLPLLVSFFHLCAEPQADQAMWTYIYVYNGMWYGWITVC